MPRLRRALLALTLAPLVVTALTAGGTQAAEGTTARTDKATIGAGTTKTIPVLANDRVAGGKAAAKIRLLRNPTDIPGRVTRRGISVQVAATAKPGTYTLVYKVTGARNTSDKAAVKVTIPASTTKPTEPATATPTPTTAPTPDAPTAADTLTARIAALPVAPEHRDGYNRDLYKHWNSGAVYGDGCDTRSEVLKAEAVVPVAAGTACPIYTSRSGGGQWYSYYDGVTTTDPSGFDIDHMVALAEAHDSGAWSWDAATREAFANDLGDPRSLVAVTANSNRSKGDQDPAEWLPLLERCRYIAEWVAVKTRWGLTADQTEKDALAHTAQGCENVTVAVIAR